MAEPIELPAEAERLLAELAIVESHIKHSRDRLDRRQMEIAEALSREARKEAQASPAAEHLAIRERFAVKLNEVRRTTYRSELAQLAADLVTDERRRARILRQLDAFPQLGETVPAVDLGIEYDGERDLVIKTGGGRNFRIKLPIVIDRGVWRGDGQYQRGDGVTSDGSFWIAREDNPAHEPGKGAQWRLAVQRGKNGRDMKRNPT